MGSLVRPHCPAKAKAVDSLTEPSIELLSDRMERLSAEQGNAYKKPSPESTDNDGKRSSDGIKVTEAPLTVEEYLASLQVQRWIVAQATAIGDDLAYEPEEDEESDDCGIDSGVVQEPLLSVPLFEFLLETSRLPEFVAGKMIIYQLVSNKLVVELLPSLSHDAAAESFADDLIRWSESGGSLNCLGNVVLGCTPADLPLANLH
jgi:hypothetical protein